MFLRALGAICNSDDIIFDAKKNHVRCIAHVMNLSVQAILRAIRVEIPQDEEELFEEIENDGEYLYSGEVSSKV